MLAWYFRKKYSDTHSSNNSQKHKDMATIYFGAPNEKNLGVSETLKRMDLNLLRSTPAASGVVAHRDYPQHGFDFYSQNLPIFIKSRIMKDKVFILAEGFEVSIPTEEILPFTIPPVILRWKSSIADEVISGVKNRLSYEELTTSNAKGPALSVTVETADDLRFILQLKADPITPCVDYKINPQAILPLIKIIKIATMFLRVHTYPMVYDETHSESLQKHYSLEDEDISMGQIGEDGERIVYEGTDRLKRKFDGHEIPIPKELAKSYVRMVQAAVSTEDTIIKDIPEIPNSKGLWFPYIAELSNWDKTTVPEVIEEKFIKILGSNALAQRRALDSIKSEWGIICNTDTGKELSHLYKGIQLCLQAQSRIMPYFTNDIYQGFVMIGDAYMVRNRAVYVRPVSFDELKGAVIDSSVHQVVLRKIGTLLNVTTDYNPRTSKEFALNVREAALTEETKREILDLARSLSFRENHYGVNQTSFSIIANIITHITRLDDLPEDFPIHPTLIFSNKIAHIAWGAFGDMAPSFKVPSGEKLSLEKVWKESAKEKGATVSREVSRIACRVCELKLALDDLDWMMSEKSVLNPLKRAAVRRGRFNMDRFFTGREFVNIITSLRQITSVVVNAGSSSNKRSADDEAENDRATKRALLDEI